MKSFWSWQSRLKSDVGSVPVLRQHTESLRGEGEVTLSLIPFNLPKEQALQMIIDNIEELVQTFQVIT